MDPYILAMGWTGIFAPLALGAIGSMVGVARATRRRRQTM